MCWIVLVERRAEQRLKAVNKVGDDFCEMVEEANSARRDSEERRYVMTDGVLFVYRSVFHWK